MDVMGIRAYQRAYEANAHPVNDETGPPTWALALVTPVIEYLVLQEEESA